MHIPLLLISIFYIILNSKKKFLRISKIQLYWTYILFFLEIEIDILSLTNLINFDIDTGFLIILNL
jgi:hypothetical protein